MTDLGGTFNGFICISNLPISTPANANVTKYPTTLTLTKILSSTNCGSCTECHGYIFIQQISDPNNTTLAGIALKSTTTKHLIVNASSTTLPTINYNIKLYPCKSRQGKPTTLALDYIYTLSDGSLSAATALVGQTFNYQ